MKNPGVNISSKDKSDYLIPSDFNYYDLPALEKSFLGFQIAFD